MTETATTPQAHVPAIRRTLPETVTMPTERFVEILGYLNGAGELLETLEGSSPAPGQEILDRFWNALEYDFLGPAVVNEDEADSDEEEYASLTDPVYVEVSARGHEVAAELLEAMAKSDGGGLWDIIDLGLLTGESLEHFLRCCAADNHKGAQRICRARSIG